MLGKIVAIDIADELVAAVALQRNLQGFEVESAAAVLVNEEGPQAALDRLRGQLDMKNAQVVAMLDPAAVSFRTLSLPFSDLKKIRQTLPFELEPLAAQAVEKLVVDFLPVASGDTGTRVLAAAVERSHLAGMLETFTASGLQPQVMELRSLPLASALLREEEAPADGLCLDLGLRRATLVLWHRGKVALVRSVLIGEGGLGRLLDTAPDGIGLEAVSGEEQSRALGRLAREIRLTVNGFAASGVADYQPGRLFLTGCGALLPGIARRLEAELGIACESLNLLERCAKGRLAAKLQGWQPRLFDGCLALALRAVRADSGFDFLREEFEPASRLWRFDRRLRLAALLLLAAGVVGLVDFGIGHYGLVRRNVALDQQLASIFSRTFPEVTRVVDPVRQMRGKIDELSKSAVSLPGFREDRKVLDLLAAISSAVPPSLQVEVSRMVIDQDGVLVRGTTDTFNTVDSLKKGLETAGVFRDVLITSANLDRDGRQVQFELRLPLGR